MESRGEANGGTYFANVHIRRLLSPAVRMSVCSPLECACVDCFASAWRLNPRRSHIDKNLPYTRPRRSQSFPPLSLLLCTAVVCAHNSGEGGRGQDHVRHHSRQETAHNGVEPCGQAPSGRCAYCSFDWTCVRTLKSRFPFVGGFAAGFLVACASV